MKILDPSEHTPMTIDEQGTRRFEAFLDRNFGNWRNQEFMRAKNKGHISRSWSVGIDDVERVALYRGEYVEIYDQYFSKDDEGEIQIEYPKSFICDIDGDLTPVAVWGNRQPD